MPGQKPGQARLRATRSITNSGKAFRYVAGVTCAWDSARPLLARVAAW
jgi:hypothetical protein